MIGRSETFIQYLADEMHVEYEWDSNAGISLGGVKKWGTFIKWRVVGDRKWQRFTIWDLHPFDKDLHTQVRAAIRKQWVKEATRA